MPQSLVQIYVHLVFSTKDREPFLRDHETRNRMHAYLAGICGNLDSSAVKVGGVEDHVHVLTRLGKMQDVSTLIRELKRDSSKWVKGTWPELQEFAWQAGYGAFSVSPSHIAALGSYIASQELHHRKETF